MVILVIYLRTSVRMHGEQLANSIIHVTRFKTITTTEKNTTPEKTVPNFIRKIYVS